MILRVIAWAVWLFFLYVTISYIPGTKEALELSPANIETSTWFSKFAIVIIIVAIIEAGLTLLLRHFALIKPVQKGTYNIESIGGSIRFLFVNILIWFIAETLPVYGLILYIISEQIAFFYSFSIAGIILLIIHAPRLSPYKIVASSA